MIRLAAALLGLAVVVVVVDAVREPAREIRATLSVTEALAGADTAGYARALEPRPFVFPRDHADHPAFRNEWWYITGTLDGDERRFGFQFTLFRSALAAEPPALDSDWATRQVYMGHFALTDPAAGRFHAFDRFGRAALGIAGARAVPFRVWLLDWELAGSETGSAGPECVFPLRLRAAAGEVAVDLALEAGKGIVLQGERGLSRKGPEPGNASYYYSFPRMPARGTVVVEADTVPVSGAAWLDREWSTSALGPDLEGWDWFALRFEDGRDLMYYRLRRSDGGTDPLSGGVLVRADGSAPPLSADDVVLEVLDRWTSPTTGVTYPSRWRVSVPETGLELTLTPWLRNQELDVAFRYWEGAVDAVGRDRQGPVRGAGYVELTGYGTAGGRTPEP